MFDLDYNIKRVFELNEKWWRDLDTNRPIDRNEGELFMLKNSEIAEAMEGSRKNLMDDKLPQYPMDGVEMVDFAIRIIDYCSRRGVKLQDWYEARHEHWETISRKANRADLQWQMVCRLVDGYRADPIRKYVHFSFLLADARHYCRIFGYDFEAMFDAKFQYNVDRQDHKHEARKLANGKKF